MCVIKNYECNLWQVSNVWDSCRSVREAALEGISLHPISTLSPQEATLTYQRFLTVLRKKKIKKAPAQTPQEFAGTFSGTPIAGLVAEFTGLYNMLRFGGTPVSLARLRELVEQIRRTRTIRS